MDVHNDSGGWLVLWLEPLGEDRWLKPGDRFRIRTDYVGDDPAFSVTYWVDNDDRAAGIENVNVWVENGDVDAEVTDAAGVIVECGHQCPDEVTRKREALAAERKREASKGS